MWNLETLDEDNQEKVPGRVIGHLGVPASVT